MNSILKPITGMLALLFAATLLSSCSSDETADIAQTYINVELRIAEISAAQSGMVFPAKVESRHQANLSTIIMGTVTSAPVTVGDLVEKGDVLVRIKDDQILAQKSQIEASMVQAKANLENTETNYHRITNLYAQESATSKELDDISTMVEIAKANMAALEARLNEVNEMLSYTVIRAPFTGIVSSKFVSEGDMAAPGHPLVTVSDPGAIKITASVAENQISLIEKGSMISVSVPSAGVERVAARLTAVSQSGDPISRQFSVEAVIDDTELTGKLKVGMFAQIGINTQRRETVTVPSESIVERGQLTGIYTLSDNQRAVLRWVRLGDRAGDSVEVLTGLKPGEQYVYAPGQSIRQGQLLNVR